LQVIRICNRIEDSNTADANAYQTPASPSLHVVKQEKFKKRLLRLYDLACVVKMETPVQRSSEFAGFLVEKSDMLAHSEGQVQDALLVYDRALRVFGYEAPRKDNLLSQMPMIFHYC